MASFVAEAIDQIRESTPSTWDKKHDAHVRRTKERSEILKNKWDTPLRPHGFWKTGKFNTWRNRYEKTSGRRHNGFVPVGVDKNGHPIAANSYDSCLAQLDDVYAREMQFEKELSKESE
eukprot:g170.t1